VPEQGTVARAFEIAREGKCQSLKDIRHQLERERYLNVQNHLAGRSIRKQLADILIKSLKLGNAKS
jgi:hypothetical protein